MKPSPYYRNEREYKDLLARSDSFTFNDPNESPPLICLIAGKEGSGKTHMACTMSELGPVYLVDTEFRSQIVTRKFPNVRFTLVKNYSEMVVAIWYILRHQPPGTIVLDSGSDLQIFAEIEYLERTEKEKVGMPWNWSEVWRLCNAIIDDIRFSKKFNLIITSRLKEEYAGDKGTGRMIPRIYSTLPYKADIVLQYTLDKIPQLQVTKNGFTGEASGIFTRGVTLPRIIHRLCGKPEPKNGQLLQRAL